MYYVVSVDSMKTIHADSELEALEDARQEFIEMLQRGECELIITEEFDDE